MTSTIELARAQPSRWALVLLASLGLAQACKEDQGATSVEDASDRADAPEAGSEAPASLCDGRDEGAACDKGRYCRSGSCQTNRCGDGMRAGAEFCDDGNLVAGDGCDPVCSLETPECGDGKLQAPEECDDGNWFDDDACSTGCTLNRCGNNRVDVLEECDDGNAVDDDHCSNSCLVYECRNGRLEPGEECDDGNTVDRGDGCTNDCLVSICGNGKLEKNEECDDGNRVNEPFGVGGCPNTCRYAVCGNGVVESPEACDGPHLFASAAAPKGINFGFGASPYVWAGCTPDCKNVVELGKEACGTCVKQRCRQYLGVDIIAACMTAVNSDLGPDPKDPVNTNYLQLCVDAVNCALVHKCGNSESPGPAECYCGSQSLDDCAANGPAADAVCANEFRLAARAATNTDVAQRFTDLTYPLGVAYAVLQCAQGPGGCGLKCDPGYCGRTRDPISCDADGKLHPTCGNGREEGAEACDDDNALPGDGCSPTCQREPPVCGNGRVEEGEACDDGNKRAGDGCSAACQTET